MTEQSVDTDAGDSQLPPRQLRIASRRDTRQSGWAAFAQDPEVCYSQSDPDQNTQRRVGSVSIWIGLLPDKRSLELYVERPNDSFNLEEGEEEFCPLWDDLGYKVVHESILARSHEKPVPVVELIHELAGFIAFEEPFLASCRSLGIDMANAVIAIFGLEYFGARSLCFGRLRYIGAFNFA